MVCKRDQVGGRSPFYGFSASPLVSNGVVVLPIGGENGKSITGFDAQTGKMKWSMGDDMVNYQSPVLMSISGKQRIIAANDKKIFVIDRVTGNNLLEYEHGGDENIAATLVPLPLDQDRLLLRNKRESTDLIKFSVNGQGSLTANKLWSASIFKYSYDPPVYYKGYLYGLNGRILSCVNAESGETKWKSRGVGDGFVILVNGLLVIQTKTGKLHVGSATPEGWKEFDQVTLFKDVSWSEPSYSCGAIFSRSHGEIARLDWNRTAQATAVLKRPISTLPPGSKFAALVEELEKSSEKKTILDRFFSEQKQFPIVQWPDQVIFVYRGPGEDIAFRSEIDGWENEIPMQRVAGTDLFFYTARLEPDARIQYRFVRNFHENIVDAFNPQTSSDRRFSSFAMMICRTPIRFFM